MPEQGENKRTRRGRGVSREPSDRGGLGAPPGPTEPVGRDRARTRGDAPPRSPRSTPAPPRPPLPDDEEPQLPKGVRREIERALGKGRRGRDVALALSVAAAAIDEERPDVATEVLAWAKHQAPRIAAIREAYGVALYLREEYAPALSELQAYRRLSGSSDQNHLVADCLRALGRDVDRVGEVARELMEDARAPADRRAEASIVWAAALADAGELSSARAVLRRQLAVPRDGDEQHDLRVRWLAAELAERDGDRAEARRQLVAVSSADPEDLEVAERLEQLPPDDTHDPT